MKGFSHCVLFLFFTPSPHWYWRLECNFSKDTFKPINSHFLKETLIISHPFSHTWENGRLMDAESGYRYPFFFFFCFFNTIYIFLFYVLYMHAIRLYYFLDYHKLCIYTIYFSNILDDYKCIGFQMFPISCIYIGALQVNSLFSTKLFLIIGSLINCFKWTSNIYSRERRYIL